ncbi:GIY-YIG nuclease family protein [Streptomyces chartreusis]|uniref:GIY-YIG nuclease family protein n=1 Tax=Streptomyces chartreusis TaxID=1969 RepID=UPI002E178E19
MGAWAARWYSPAAVYRLWDADGGLLYIGSAYDPEERCRRHRDKPWWPDVTRRTEEWRDSRGEAYTAELEAIALERPQHNVMGTREYTTPDTPAIRRRNAMASIRGRYLHQSGELRIEITNAARQAGYSHREADRLGRVAEVEFLDRTGIFVDSVRRRRRALDAEAAARPGPPPQ